MKFPFLPFHNRKRIRNQPYSASSQPVVLRILLAPFRKITSIFSNYFKTKPKFYEEPQYKEKVSFGAILQSQNWFRWNIELFYNWFLTRPYGGLALGLPAILAMFVVLCLFGLSNPKQHQRVNSLSAILKTAYLAQDNTAVELCLRSLLQVKPDRTDLQVAHAVALTALDRKDEAIESMKGLYLATSSTRAAFWLATNTLDLNELREWTLEQHNEFREYMKAALSSSDDWSIDDREIVMAKYLVGIQAKNEAIGFLAKLEPDHPELALTTSILCASMGDSKSAQFFAARATEHHRVALREKQSDLQIRANLVQALVIQNREEEALQVIDEGLVHSNSPEIRQLKSDTLIMWSHRIKSESETDAFTGKRLNLIFEAVKSTPNRPIVMDAVFDIAMECRKSPDPEVRNLLTQTVQSVDPHVLHMLRGTVAAMDGDLDKAIYHLRIAEPSATSLPVIYNNLAVAISSKSDANLLEALRLVELAILGDSKQFYFRETRGQILAKLDRHEEALRELEAAMFQTELLPLILPTMITSCYKLGLDTTAKEYEEKLSSLRAKGPAAREAQPRT